MKGAKLVDIFRYGNIVIPIFLLKNYKKFNLEMQEFIFLMFLYHLGNYTLFNPNKFVDDLGLDLKDVMNYIGILTDKGFLTVEVQKNDKGLMEEVISLDGFYQKIALLTIDEVSQEESSINIFEVIEKEFGRTLSSMEYEIIKAWLDSNIKVELIREAVKEATFNGVSNLRYIDKILYEWGKVGIETVEDVENMRKKRNNKVKETDIDLESLEWNWFDEDE